MLGGDLNYPGFNWKEGKIEILRSNPAEASNFLEIVRVLNIIFQVVTQPTRNNTTLEFVFMAPLMILRPFMFWIKSVTIILFSLKRDLQLNIELLHQKWFMTTVIRSTKTPLLLLFKVSRVRTYVIKYLFKRV